jgi:hypothetical protein
MDHRYFGLVETDPPSETFIRRTLGVLEADLRRVALLALGAW